MSPLALHAVDSLAPQDRLFPHRARTYYDWNVRPLRHPNPLFLTHSPSADAGFTAVILTYDRLESLFQVMTRVAETPSLVEIVVVWNHQGRGRGMDGFPARNQIKLH